MRKFLIILAFLFPIEQFANPIESLLERIDRGASKKFQIELIASEEDYFELDQNKDKVVVRGNNYISIACGINWYLKYYADVHLCWNNMNVKLPKQLPLVRAKERRSTKCEYRYYLNYCTFSYTMPFWDWERWEREIDWMALHGINLVLSTTGSELVWFNLLKELGYSENEISTFIAGPCFLAWWQMNNLEGWGGPTSLNRYKSQSQLQKKILKRLNEWGIEPILPGYCGMLPHKSKDKLNINSIETGTWCGYIRPDFLLPEDEAFSSIANLYYQKQKELYGEAKFYAMDPFHEGGNAHLVDFEKMGKSITKAMKQHNPNATWVIQAWEGNPNQTMLNKINKGDLLILDLWSETKPQWGDPHSPFTRENGFGEHNWIYSMLLNFGANVGLFGKTDAIINSFYEAKNHPKYSSTLKGIGLTPEGIENNPMMYELFSELAWRDSIFNKSKWIESYTKARYGNTNKQIVQAWEILINTIYNCPKNNQQQGTHESIFCARPLINAKQVSAWANPIDYYSPDSIINAAKLLISIAEEYKGNNNFEYDLIDITRQAIAEKGRITLKEIKYATEKSDTVLFKQCTDYFLKLILLQDELLSTRSEFMLGKWLQMAKKVGKNKSEKTLYERNARTQITTWGNRIASEAGKLHDYAHKEWSGLLKDLYYKRWQVYFSGFEFKDGKYTEPTIDFFAIDEEWCSMKNKYPSQPQSNTIETTNRIFFKIFP